MSPKLFIYILFCICLADSHIITRRETTTEAPETDQEQTDDVGDEPGTEDEACGLVSDRALMAAEYFPDTISRERVLKMFKRAIELIEKPSTSSKRPCRRDAGVEADAKNALRFLTGEPTIGSTTDDSSRSSGGQNPEDEYCPDIMIIENQRRVSNQTIKRILQLSDKGYSEKAIKSQYKWFHRQYIPRMRSYEEASGRQSNTYEDIADYVQRKINDSLAKKLPIHDYHLQQWGLDRADELHADFFRASERWLTNVKKRADIVGRKVTDLSSRSDRANEATIEESRLDFAENYREVSRLFPHHRILNTDQSGHKYEISNLRSLARRGTRDHVLAIDSVNKNKHSYTVQPIIGRDGRPHRRLLICFREPADDFGVEVVRRVRTLQTELGNVVAVASRSGKMSRSLTLRWVDELLEPEIARLDEADSESLSSQDSQATELAGPSWASNPPESWTPEQQRIMNLRNTTAGNRRPGVMLLIDSWGGHSSDSLAQELETRNIFVLRIPPRTTADLQPLDVQVFRQYKIFVKRITEAASYEGIDRDLTDRYGIMRMHSIIWNQFQAPVYRDMFLWAWRHTDPDFDQDELENSPPPDMVLNIQFEFKRSHRCEVPGCNSRAFIRCAHCGEHLCLKHFLDRKGFHEDGEPVNYGNTSSTARPSRRDHDDDGSAGAAAAAIAAGPTSAGAIGVGSGAAIAASISASGAGGRPGSSGSRYAQSKEERIPLVDTSNVGVLERVEVLTPAISLKDLIRDQYERGLPPRC